MTSKEFEMMRKAQKHETDLAVLRELDSLKSDIKITDRDYKFNGQILPIDVVLEIIDKHMKGYEE